MSLIALLHIACLALVAALLVGAGAQDLRSMQIANGFSLAIAGLFVVWAVLGLGGGQMSLEDIALSLGCGVAVFCGGALAFALGALGAATTGDVATADRALEAAIAEGAGPVQVLRAALGHLQKLHRARLSMDEHGVTAADAAKGIRPPLFYQKVGAFTRSLGLWPSATLTAAMAALAEAERGCKRTGWPDQALCRNAVLTLARRSALASRNPRR